MQLTPKEASLLKDLKGQEQLCVDKYNRHAASANDPQLKNLFKQIAQVEQQHLDAITQMTSGTVAASFDASSLKEVDGQLQLSFTVYNYEKFDAAYISGLKAGDVLVVSGREMTVASVQASDGYVTVNGGEEAGGVLFSLDASSNTYYVMGMDDSKTYYEKGQLTFPVADTCVLTDDADFEHPGQTTPASDLPKLLAQDDIYGFNPQSTTVTLKNSQITAIYRGFLP